MTPAVFTSDPELLFYDACVLEERSSVIVPNQAIDVSEVATHYDELDVFYREIWGEHVHHGLWRSGNETPAEATLALVKAKVSSG